MASPSGVVPLADMPPGLLTDPAQQHLAYEYVEGLKADPDGWRRCVRTLIDDHNASPQQQFILIQVVEHHIRHNYARTKGDESAAPLYDLLQFWAARFSQPGFAQSLPTFIKNKMAALWASVFFHDYPGSQSEFWQATLGAEQWARAAPELYLRLALAVDSLVADREIMRSKEEMERCTAVKDAMRANLVHVMARCWHGILAETRGATDSVTVKLRELCLNAAGAYVSWIDADLIVNDVFLQEVLLCMNPSDDNSELWSPAADCLCSCVSKGMDWTKKLRLIDYVDEKLKLAGIYDIGPDADPDFVAAVALVVNAIGTAIVPLLNNKDKEGQMPDADAAKALVSLETKLRQALGCLLHDDLCVSGAVTELCHQFVLVCKNAAAAPPNGWSLNKELIRDLLIAVLRKYRLPDDYNWDKEGEDEIEFLEYRKDLKIIITNIGLMDSDLLVSTIHELVTSSLNNWQMLHHYDVELALSMIYFIGEAVQTNQGTLFTSKDSSIAARLREMIHLVLTSGVSASAHAACALEYHEIVCRYEKYFNVAPDDGVRPALAAFLDQRGLRHPHPKVRARVVYLFARFVKMQRSLVQNYVPDILAALGDLLAAGPEQDAQSLLTVDDQLFLYEAAGTLIVAGAFDPPTQRAYMHQLIGNLAEKFSSAAVLLDSTPATDTERCNQIFAYLNNIMAFAGRTTKAFSNQTTMHACMCADIFLELLAAFVSCASKGDGGRAALLSGLRQYAHRMVVCAGDDLLPRAADLVLACGRLAAVAAAAAQADGADAQPVHDVLVLVQQIVGKYKERSVNALGSQAIGGIFDLALATSARPTSPQPGRDDGRYVRRALLALINASLTSDAPHLIAAAGPDTRNRLLNFVASSLADGDDVTAQKAAFAVCHRLCEAAARASGPGATGAEQALFADGWLEQFTAFYYGQVVVAATVGLQKTLRSDDAGGPLVLHEAAVCLKRAVAFKGADALAAGLRPHWPNDGALQCDQLVQRCVADEPKALAKYLKTLCNAESR